MLRARVIPIVLLNGFSVIKTIQFDVRRNLGNPITVARIYNTRNVDELILLDIDATKQNRSIDIFTIEDIASECFMPLTVGGGIKTLGDIQNLLKKGADKVSINSQALMDPSFIKASSEVYGKQCIVGSVDITHENGQFKIHSQVESAHTGKNPVEWCQELEHLGAGELLINFVHRDGMMDGIEEEYIRKITTATQVPVISAGGVANPTDCSKMYHAGASGIAAASIYHFTNFTPNDCKRHMQQDGIPVRL